MESVYKYNQMATVMLSVGQDSGPFIFSLRTVSGHGAFGSCYEYTGFGGQFTVHLKAETQRVLNVIGTK